MPNIQEISSGTGPGRPSSIMVDRKTLPALLASGKTQKQIADSLGVTESAISHAKRDQGVREALARAYARHAEKLDDVVDEHHRLLFDPETQTCDKARLIQQAYRVLGMDGVTTMSFNQLVLQVDAGVQLTAAAATILDAVSVDKHDQDDVIEAEIVD